VPAVTARCLDALAIGGSAVLVGIPPEGARVDFQPQNLVDLDQRIIGSNYGGIRPARDIPRLVGEYLAGELFVDELISARRPLEDAEDALAQLASGTALRQLLLPGAS
jgi:S-(hydroxymethyl)glutathione dehydrogenase/alcohol dehydrogenase